MKYSINDFYRSAAANFVPQFFAISSGLAKVILIPLYLSVTEFGYWQIYLLYFSYLGIASLGYGDGVFLKHAGQNENRIPMQKVKTGGSFYLFLLTASAVAVFIFFGRSDIAELNYIYLCLFLTVFSLGYNSLVFSVLLSKGEFKIYALYNSLDKFLFLIFCFVFSISDYLKAYGLIFFLAADVFSKYLVSIFILFKERFTIFVRQMLNLDSFSVFVSYASAGIYVLISNFSEILFLTLPRLFAEQFLDLITFSNLAFGFSLASVIVIASMAVSTIAMPFIRNSAQANVQRAFSLVVYVFCGLLFLFFMLYDVLIIFIQEYFSKFSQVVDLLPLIFLSTYCLIRFQIYNSNFYKALRLEKKLLLINLFSIFLAIVSYLTLGLNGILTPLILVSTFLGFAIFRNLLSDFFILNFTFSNGVLVSSYFSRNAVAVFIELISIFSILLGIYYSSLYFITFLMLSIILVLFLNSLKVVKNAKV